MIPSQPVFAFTPKCFFYNFILFAQARLLHGYVLRFEWRVLAHVFELHVLVTIIFIDINMGLAGDAPTKDALKDTCTELYELGPSRNPEFH